MEVLLLGAPSGFQESCLHLSKPENLTQIRALAHSALQGANFSGASSKLAPLHDALRHIYDSARTYKVDAAGLKKSLTAHTELSPAAVEAILASFAAEVEKAGSEKEPGLLTSAAPALSQPASAGSGAQLASAEWTLAVTSQSSSCANLQEPVVALRLNLRDKQQLLLAAGSGAGGAAAEATAAPLRVERLELSLGQLKVLEMSLTEALAALEKS